MEEDARVVLFQFIVHLVVTIFERGDGGGDVVYDDHPDMFLEASGC